MMNIFCAVMVLSLLLGASGTSFAQEASLTTEINHGKPVKIRYRSKRHRGDAKVVMIRDKATQKRAVIALPLKDAKEGLYEGTFVIIFDAKEEDAPKNVAKIILDVFPVKATSTRFAPSTDIKKENVVLLQSNQQEKERIAYELAESQRRDLLEKQAQALSAQERKNRQLMAATLATEAMTLYQNKNYFEASKKFKDAIEFDPSNNKYYFQYGVSLFQEEEFQKSLVALSMADEGDFSRVDKNYFIGMNYYRLNDTDSALKYLVEVRDENDEILSATASYYAGLLQYSSSRFGDAKDSFGYVLDRSKDPRMDESAESYLEKIDAIEQFNSKFKDKWAYELYGAVMYDSNILSVAEANVPTDVSGLRFLYGASLERRLIFDFFKEWSLVASVSDIYSTSRSFEAKDELQNTDPLVFSIKSPVKWKTNLFEKNYILSVTPGFEAIMLNADAEGPRENTSNAMFLTLSNSFFHRENWIGNYDLDIRSDNSSIEATAEEDQTALKTSVGTTQMFIKDPKEGEVYMADAFLIFNAAQGDNQTYNRFNMGFTYMKNFYWKSQGAARLDIGTADYPNHLTGRKDSNYGITLSAAKPLTPKWKVTLSAGWSDNTSSIEMFDYDKYFISNMYTYSGAF